MENKEIKQEKLYPSIQIHNITKIKISKKKRTLIAKAKWEKTREYEIFDLTATTETGDLFRLSAFSKEGPIEIVQKEDG